MINFETWLQRLQEKRQRWIDANHENDFDRGIWNATVEKYADPTHFIFELLQNAEDAGATRASFRVGPKAITFEHDGKAFDRNDIEGITGIGNTTKLEEANKIGCFGIGFKSVYVVTERPEVHCAIEGMPIAFCIRDLVVPELIATAHVASTTRIVLPLQPEKSDAIVAQVRAALAASGSRCLLFLKSLAHLEWTDGVTIVQWIVEDGIGGFRTLRSTVDSKRAEIDRFIVMNRSVGREDKRGSHSVKVAWRLDESGDIAPETTSTRLAVFFETEETTGLRFQVHGPFQLTDNRANIKRDDPWNTLLITEVAKLVAESLSELRDRGLIKRNFLEVMPNAGDDLPEMWRPVLAAVVEAFQSGELIPAHGGGHVSARVAVRGPSDVRDLLGGEGLAAFGAVPGRRWVSGGVRNTRVEAFLSTIKIVDWGTAELLAAFHKAFSWSWSAPDIAASKKAQAWFDALPDGEVQRLYLLVESAIKAQKQVSSLTQLSFVRLEDGARTTPAKALLSPAGAALDEEAAGYGLALVRSALTRTGRARGKEVEQFLRRVGVKEIGERDYLGAIVRGNYAEGERAPSTERHLQHMRRFLRWYAETNNCDLLKGASFLRVEGADGYFEPDSVFLDMPFVHNGLSRVYGGRVEGRDRRPLWSGYSRLKRPELLALIKAVGVEEALRVEETRIPYNHPKRNTLFHGFGGARTTSTGTNSDYTIADLPELLAIGDPQISKMIWKAVSTAGAKCMYALHAPNQTYDPNRELSTLAIALRKAEWIPVKGGGLRRPGAISAADLVDGLSTAGNDTWLNVIDFGADQRERSEQHQARRRAVQVIGFPKELADQLELLSPEAMASLGSEMVQRISSGAFTMPEFPEREAPNPERRAHRLAERARAAPAKAYEQRGRTVRTTDKEAKQLARPYLRDLYTNGVGDMICQACHHVMPFRLADGAYYFETPELFQSASTELAENHLALCPNCSAKWQHANSMSDSEIGEALRKKGTLEVPVTIAAEAVRLRFVQVHFDDLRTIFELVTSP